MNTLSLTKRLARLSNIIADKKLQISIDTFHPSIALKLIKKYKISVINDVKGDFDDDYLRAIASSGCKFCLMHSITISADKSHIVLQSVDLVEYLISWERVPWKN